VLCLTPSFKRCRRSATLGFSSFYSSTSSPLWALSCSAESVSSFSPVHQISITIVYLLHKAFCECFILYTRVLTSETCAECFPLRHLPKMSSNILARLCTARRQESVTCNNKTQRNIRNTFLKPHRELVIDKADDCHISSGLLNHASNPCTPVNFTSLMAFRPSLNNVDFGSRIHCRLE